MAEAAPARERRKATLPDFCSVGSVFTLVIVAELVVAIDALAPDAHMGLRGFTTATAFVVWLALLAALLLCKLRPLLQRLPPLTAYLLGSFALTLLVGAASIVVAWLDHSMELGLTPVSTSRFVLGNAALAALLSLALMRYFQVLGEWRARLDAVARAQFDALQARIRPHFLYNSMNTVAALVRVDPDAAERTVENLSELFRAALGASGKPSTLGAELALIDRYLAIEQLRLGDRLRVERAFDDLPLQLEMPALLLQPLVENAIKYAVAKQVAGGLLRIEAERDGEQLVLRVIDDGPGCSAIEGDQLPPGKGVGLRNTRERLHVLYGDTGGFSVRNRERGIEVALRLPFETSQTLGD